MTPTMTPTATPASRRTCRTASLLRPVVLVCTLVLTGCSSSGDEEQGAPGPEASSSAVPTDDATQGASGDAVEGEPTDTYTDSPIPTTVEVPVEDLPGFAALRVWDDDDELIEGPRQVTGGLVVEQGELAVLVASTEALITAETAAAEMRDWRRHNGYTSETAELLEPVIVDGQEVLHARGESGLQQYDLFLRLADNGDALRFVFSTPVELGDAEREEYLGSVLSTVEFA